MAVLDDFRGLSRRPVLRVLALCSLLVAIAAISLEARTLVRDPDNWFHLKVGEWILQNRSFPHTGLFSGTAANSPWMAYSWGYEVLLALSYKLFGLIGLASYGLLLTLAVAGVFYFVLYRLSRNFWIAWLLCGIASYAFLFKSMPRPVFFSMACFAIVLMLVLEAQRKNKVELLYPVPVVFLLWANCHIQFIYGLFALGLFVAVTIADRAAAHFGLHPGPLVRNSLPLIRLIGVLAISAAVVGISPYGYKLYAVVFTYAQSKVPYTFIQELQAPEFRYPTDYVLLLLMGAGYFVLGRQKNFDVFKILLIVVASVFAFRTARDVWFVGICSAAFIADMAFAQTASENQGAQKFSRWELATVPLVLVMLTALIAPPMGLKTRDLDRVISRNFPVDAVNFVRKHPVQGPLYNDFNWGGFLIWYMPDHPVSIDGRTDLYGDDKVSVAMRSLGGNYEDDPYLKLAKVVILNKQFPLPWRLSSDPNFRIEYQDQIAVVFVRNE